MPPPQVPPSAFGQRVPHPPPGGMPHVGPNRDATRWDFTGPPGGGFAGRPFGAPGLPFGGPPAPAPKPPAPPPKPPFYVPPVFGLPLNPQALPPNPPDPPSGPVGRYGFLADLVLEGWWITGRGGTWKPDPLTPFPPRLPLFPRVSPPRVAPPPPPRTERIPGGPPIVPPPPLPRTERIPGGPPLLGPGGPVPPPRPPGSVGPPSLPPGPYNAPPPAPSNPLWPFNQPGSPPPPLGPGPPGQFGPPRGTSMLENLPRYLAAVYGGSGGGGSVGLGQGGL